ncbi:hypothetical protein TVAG_457780 [Trichomonas vaginalis G3]|uniref:Uncharacterized protein n=1 Tax=Trichomonas vaginalis (strain ATCC PRA-98 / G3) TaxID=412133 RepID=A2F7L8_TRIV3|nr:hypothetical protein TVAGG3_0909460 [Trichomonas vaginalis G3]EAX99087.1 hypothetical protein TVAG_457780 [Trichomonas vaginalis G3]KAI5484314.1 hypothetical protein TVAGG3_0909460 [Trichomonas vaginalis G3]|eukprot:XP_001312017.1 hypothetical protein [Trichomonas vaginalis G3]
MNSMKQNLLDSDAMQYNVYTDNVCTPPRMNHNMDGSDSDYYYSPGTMEDNYEDEIPDEATIASKEVELEQLRQYNKDMKLRFIWDLSLAMKRKLCSQHDVDTAIFQNISNIQIMDIIDTFELEQPPISAWTAWILEKLTCRV